MHHDADIQVEPSPPPLPMLTLLMPSALKYLNSQQRPIVHYDLKPGNILFHQGFDASSSSSSSWSWSSSTTAVEK